jgi:type VI secretion system protein VasD
LLLTSCSHKRVYFFVNGTATLNPDESGNPLPVVLRIYQLKDKEGIEEAEFKSLWKEDAKVLKESLLDRQEVTIFPGAGHQIQIALKKETNYLMAMALFRKPDGKTWRRIVPVRNPDAKSVTIVLDQQRIDLLDVKKRWMENR